MLFSEAATCTNEMSSHPEWTGGVNQKNPNLSLDPCGSDGFDFPLSFCLLLLFSVVLLTVNLCGAFPLSSGPLNRNAQIHTVDHMQNCPDGAHF